MSVRLDVGQVFSLEKSAFNDFESMTDGDTAFLTGETNNNGNTLHDADLFSRGQIN